MSTWHPHSISSKWNILNTYSAYLRISFVLCLIIWFCNFHYRMCSYILFWALLRTKLTNPNTKFITSSCCLLESSSLILSCSHCLLYKVIKSEIKLFFNLSEPSSSVWLIYVDLISKHEAKIYNFNDAFFLILFEIFVEVYYKIY